MKTPMTTKGALQIRIHDKSQVLPQFHIYSFYYSDHMPNNMHTCNYTFIQATEEDIIHELTTWLISQ
jgi:hypothetical protein